MPKSNKETTKLRKPPKVSLAKDVVDMMYGFGDVRNPLPQTVAVVEDIIQGYIVDITRRAVEISRFRGKLKPEDFIFVVRKDRKKYARVVELVNKEEIFERAKKNFDDKKYIQST